MKRIFNKLFMSMGLGVFSLLSTSIYASGYKMEFQSASTLGDAGDAAVVEDAGTNWYNSAGLVYLPHQVAYSGIDVYVPTRISGTSTAPSITVPPFGFEGIGRSTSHSFNLLPGVHYTYPILPCISVGLSLVPAWGFTEDYGESALVRYNTTRVYTKTIDIAPSVAWKIDDHWSIGLGPDFHYFSVLSKFHVRTQPLTVNDSISRFTADKWGYGGHIGVLFRYDNATRVGVNYRSRILMKLEGHSDFGFDGIGFFETNTFRINVPLPPTTTVSIYRDINPCWALMGTIAYDQWSHLRNYHAKNLIGPFGIITPDVVLVQDMHDTVDFSVGTHYKLTDSIMLRGSLKYEPTPTRTVYRAVNFPDGEKIGVQIGSRYQLNKKLSFDLLYGHVFVIDKRIHDLNPVTGALTEGKVRTSIDLIGGQLIWNI